MKFIVDSLGSRRFAIFLLTVTLFTILLSNLLPNFSLMKPGEIEELRQAKPQLYSIAKTFQVVKIVKSPFFFLLPVFIFISVTLCTIKRIKGEMARNKAVKTGEMRYVAEFAAGPEAVEMFLKGGGWAVSSSVEGQVVTLSAFKGRFGFWGSVAFHAGLNIVLIGTLLSLVTRYNGSITLTEGYGVDVAEGFLGKVPDDFPVRSALMDGFKATYEGGFPVDYAMNLQLVTDFEEMKVHPKVNEPVSIGGYQISPSRYGFAPRFVLKKGSDTVFDGYINLVVFTPQQVDHFDIAEEGITVITQFFPDFYKDGLTPKSRSKELKNPMFFIDVKKGKEDLGRGFLPLNKEVSFSGYSIECKDVKTWVIFEVSRDFGVPAITFGVILIAAGLIIRFAWYEKVLWLTVKDGSLSIGGRSRYFPAMFDDELKRLADGFKGIAED